MVKHLNSSDEKNVLTNGNAPDDAKTPLPVPVNTSGQTRKKRVNRTQTESWIEESPATAVPATASGEIDEEEYEYATDETTEDFRDMFSNAGDGEKILVVKRCPGLQWTTPSNAIYLTEYPYDALEWRRQLQFDYPEGGNFWLGLKYASGPLAGKFADKRRPWEKWPVAAAPSSKRQQPAFPFQHGAFQQPQANPADAIRESMAPLREVLTVMKEMGLGPQPAPPPPPKSELEVLAMELLRKKINEDPAPRPVSEKPTTWADAFIEVGSAFVEHNPGMGTELAALAKAVLPRLIVTQPAANPAEREQAHADAEAEVIHSEPDAIDAAPETQEQPPKQKPPFDQAYAQTLGFVIGQMLSEHSDSVDKAAQALLYLANDYPQEVGGIADLIINKPPAEIKAFMRMSAGEDYQAKIDQCSPAELWIAQLQKKLKERK